METEKVRSMLESKDPELRKLGRKLCHDLRLDYWIVVQRNHLQTKWWIWMFRLDKPKVQVASVYQGYGERWMNESNTIRVHKIKLNRNGSIKAK